MSILDLLFPKRCVGCNKHGAYFCSGCINDAKLYFPKIYPHDGLIVIWKYEGAPRRLIHKLKYKFVSEAAADLASAACPYLKGLNWKKDKFVLVPIPLHWTRENWRGFNHTEEVGKILAEKMGWETQNLLIRKKTTKTQVGLRGKERKENVAGAFALKANSYKLKANSNVLLFDDVWTTGSTMFEAAKVLKKAGFKNVRCLALAG